MNTLALVSAVTAGFLALQSSSPPAPGGERSGPPLKQRTSRGTTGPITYEVFEEVYYSSADLPARRHPYAGSLYFTRPFKYAVMQGASTAIATGRST